MQIGVNHLAHFALTLRLLPLMRDRPDARIVTISSGLHKSGKIDFDDLHSERAYSPQTAYAQSKLANVYFGLELDRRLRAMGNPIKSILAHPGLASTNLGSSVAPGFYKTVMNVFISLFAQGATAARFQLSTQRPCPALRADNSSDRRANRNAGQRCGGAALHLGKDAEIAETALGENPRSSPA